MEMTGTYRIAAPRETVWAALNDPEILRASIPGCESLEKEGDDLKATVTSKIGPVKARFSGKVTLSNLNPPESYTISGEGTGGAAGFAKGGADVRLEEEGGETVLTYAANAQVGGKIAQLGGRLVDGVARKMADEFFARFAARVGAPPPVAETAAPPQVDAPPIVEAVEPMLGAAAPDPIAPTSTPAIPAQDRSGGPFGSRNLIIGAVVLVVVVLATMLAD